MAPNDAQGLYEAATTADYNVVTRRGKGRIDLAAAWLASLLKVPTPHSVTEVALSAAADRISVTGWLRGG